MPNKRMSLKSSLKLGRTPRASFWVVVTEQERSIEGVLRSQRRQATKRAIKSVRPRLLGGITDHLS